MEDKVTPFSPQAPPPPALRPPSPFHFHQQIVDLHKSVNYSIRRTQNDRAVIDQLNAECRLLKSSLDAALAREMACTKELHQERQAHSTVWEELVAKAKFELCTAESNAWLEQHAFQLQNALAVEREQHASTVTELAKMQNWCHRIDSLVDATRLEKDSKSGESRRIEDIIMDIEFRVLAEYRECIRDRDDQIVKLQHQLNDQPEA